ncbi:hypothetical protein CKO15_09650 [Halorhodospira abdelmalekii]|uniref:hypothetical protein n=1 Tax=Halorhodospira abdelmalekii TaxID=421629 RepID=UPI001904A559|nr:hypothetical protein [Halorhodospira abdelmalekii]MBK1735542.1 hypothetical protein [Halorhodospira abdelmalekii]
MSPVGGGVDLAFRAEHLRSDHCYAARCREQRRKRVGFELYEAARVQVQPGLFGGWIRLRQDDPRDDVRLRFDGHYLGVGLRSHLFASAPLSLLASTSLTWYSVSGDAEAGESEIEWLELLGRFGPVVRLGDLWLHAGLSALRSDGDQDWADGASEHFREDRNYGGFARLTVRVDETGYVGFNLEGGAREGFSVVMGRLF